MLPPGLSQDFVLDIATHSGASSHLSDRSIGDLFVGGIFSRVSPNQQRKRGRSSAPVPFHPPVQQGGNGDQLAAVSEQPAPADQLTGAVRHGLLQGRGDMSAQQAGRGQQARLGSRRAGRGSARGGVRRRQQTAATEGVTQQLGDVPDLIVIVRRRRRVGQLLEVGEWGGGQLDSLLIMGQVHQLDSSLMLSQLHQLDIFLILGQVFHLMSKGRWLEYKGTRYP